jgi:glycosyltransferase involved in cell wall biosynthesis
VPSSSRSRVRVVVLSEIPTPYRLPIYEALADEDDISLDVLFCSVDQPDRPWELERALTRVPHAVLPGVPVRIPLGRRRIVSEINPSVVRELARRRPDVLVIGGYSVPAEQAAIAWARLRRVPYILHNESQLLKPRSTLLRTVKRITLPPIVRGAAAGLAVGSAAARYLEHYGLDPSRIRIVPNTIDVARYRRLGHDARADAAARRRALHVPERYWLFAGRLLELKGIPELLAARRRLDTAPPLVVAGTGPLAATLEREPGVELLGFRGPDEVAELMALAELTVVPSRTEPWGVVVNEALAVGCPVVVSDAVGAAEDLVRDGVNGRVFPAGDVPALARALATPPPTGARDPGPVDRWDYAFAVSQFLEGIALASRR